MDSETEFKLSDEGFEQEKIMLTKDQYEDLQQRIEETKELFDKFLRLQAEFENYKKFMERQKTNYLKFGNQKLLKELIRIYNDFKRVLNGYEGPQFRGFQLILNNFSALLKSEGIEPIEAEGRVFDPEMHECMMVEQDPSLPEGAITEVLEDGYYLNGKVLRPSKVKVNK